MAAKSPNPKGFSRRISTRKSEDDLTKHIDTLIDAPIQELCNWLQVLLADRFESFAEPFVHHKIDGRCFALLTESHLKDMAPESSIGDRLYVLGVRDKMIRCIR